MTDDRTGRVRGIGGVFFKSADSAATRAWYAKHLGLATDDYGTNFVWRQADAPDQAGHTQWSPFKRDTAYFGDADQQFMINYRVDDLAALVARLRAEGVEIVDEIQTESYGKFVHIVDNDGRRVELWEPVDEEYAAMLDGVTK